MENIAYSTENMPVRLLLERCTDSSRVKFARALISPDKLQLSQAIILNDASC